MAKARKKGTKPGKSSWELSANYWSCTHKNYDPGGYKEKLIATFSTEEKAKVYLDKHKRKLDNSWGDGTTFEIHKCSGTPHDPD